MIFARTNTYGVDSKIYQIQQRLQSKLKWFDANGGVLATGEVLIFGQIYKNNSANGVESEVYLDKKDYKDQLNSDKTSCQIAFNVLSTTYENVHTAEIEIIFTCNVNELYGNESFETERAILDAERAIGYKDISGEIKRGVNDVFAGFNLAGKEYDDMAPFYVFSIPITVRYENDLCKTRVSEGTIFTADNNTITVDNNTITVDTLIL